MKSLVLFNNKGGVGKTTLTYHLAHMFSQLGLCVVALDYDPQCNLTAALVEEDTLVKLWQAPETEGRTVAACLDPVRRGRGQLRTPKLFQVQEEGDVNLWLLPGHLNLGLFEQTVAREWPQTMAQDNERALDVVLALSALAHRAAESVGADIVLCDIGPSLGALNRAALLACDHVIVPLAADLFSLQGLRNVGPTLRTWREDFETVCAKHLAQHPFSGFAGHRFGPLGYILQQHIARADRPVSSYQTWASQIPTRFRQDLLGVVPEGPVPGVQDDPHCIALVRHFASLMPLAQVARKPMFDLKQADGVGGGGFYTVRDCRNMFEKLARSVCQRMNVPVRPAQ